MEHWQRQKMHHDAEFGKGPRFFITSHDPLVQYIFSWRLKEGFQRLTNAASGRVSSTSSILVLCAGDGYEGSILCDMGYKNVTVSDISDVGVAEATKRDSRLKGMVLNAQRPDVEDNSFSVVVLQNGLHHLQSPIQGFTEMLRIGNIATLFLEPHDSLIGNTIGTKWEKNGEAVTYVFRWTKKLVQDVTSSYLGSDSFTNNSFSFWHHNVVYHRLSKALGGGVFALSSIRFIKLVLDTTMRRMGNQFCGLVIKH